MFSVITNFAEIIPSSGLCFISFCTSSNYLVNKVKQKKRTVYQLNDIICVNKETPIFGKIQFIAVNKAKEVCLIYNKFKYFSFNTHFFSYEVNETKDLKCCLFANPCWAENASIKVIKDKNYITMF